MNFRWRKKAINMIKVEMIGDDELRNFLERGAIRAATKSVKTAMIRTLPTLERNAVAVVKQNYNLGTIAIKKGWFQRIKEFRGNFVDFFEVGIKIKDKGVSLIHFIV